MEYGQVCLVGKILKKSYNDVKSSAVKTYNQTKASVSRSYNQTKESVNSNYNKTKESVSRSYNQTRDYAKQKSEDVKAQMSVATKKTLDYMDSKAAGTKNFAQDMQNAGDITVGAGAIVTLTTGATAVGAVVGGTMMTVGGATSVSGSLLESVVDLYVAGRKGELSKGTGNLFKTVGLEGGSMLTGAILGKVLPGYGKKLGEEGFDAGMHALGASVKMKEVALDRTVGAIMEK